MQLTLPDPSVQVRSLLALTKRLADKNPDLQFKIARTKTELQVDARPSQDVALRFFQHLLSEVEQLNPTLKAAKTSTTTLTSPTTTATTSTSESPVPQPKLKGLQVGDKGGGKGGAPSPKGQGDNKAVCHWFLKDEGCNRGQACKFVHDWSQAVKAERCLVCDSKSHKVKDCPRRQQEGGQDGQAAGGLNKKEARLAQAKAKPGPLFHRLHRCLKRLHWLQLYIDVYPTWRSYAGGGAL